MANFFFSNLSLNLNLKKKNLFIIFQVIFLFIILIFSIKLLNSFFLIIIFYFFFQKILIILLRIFLLELYYKNYFKFFFLNEREYISYLRLYRFFSSTLLMTRIYLILTDYLSTLLYIYLFLYQKNTIIIIMFILLSLKLKNTMFDPTYDQAVLNFNNYYPITINEIGKVKINEYLRHLILEKSFDIDFNFLWGVHFFFIDEYHNRLYKNKCL